MDCVDNITTHEVAKDETSTASKSCTTQKDIDVATEALNHFAQGKRHLLVSDISSAVNSFQEACRLLAEHYGETAIECADAYFFYGRALLELARIENGVLGNALDGVPEGSDAENSQIEDPEKLTEKEKETVSEIVGVALEENYVQNEKLINGLDKKEESVEMDVASSVDAPPTKDCKELNGEEMELVQNDEVQQEESKEEKSEEGMEVEEGAEKTEVEVEREAEKTEIEIDKAAEKTKEEVENSEDAGEENEEMGSEVKNEAASGDSEEDAEGEGDGNEDEEKNDTEEGSAEEHPEGEGDQTAEDADDVSNLQLAWEMLELSKVIYTKHSESNPKLKLKLAQVYLKLGEVGLESENYPQSLEDFARCLDLQKKELPPDSRCLAETYYQVGLAHSFSDEFGNAMDNFKAAANVIESRITNLGEKIIEKQSWSKEQKMKEVQERSDAFYTEEDEIEELERLLPEIKEKLVDMEEMRKETKERLEKLKEATFASVLGHSSGETSKVGAIPETPLEDTKPVSNITHLIRKKRKPEEEVRNEELKKSKGDETEPEVNGLTESAKVAPPLEETSDRNDEVSQNGTKTPETSEGVENTAAEEVQPKVASENSEEVILPSS